MEIKHRMGLPRMRFHLMNRGARKVSIFANDEDRRHFVHLLGKFALKHAIEVVAWSLMPNHYHLEAEGEGTPVSRMMHDLDGTYARAFNDRHKTSGCLFQGPFKSMAILDDRGLLYVSRYIHANPLALGVSPEDYPWSSCDVYLGKAAAPLWLNPKPVLHSGLLTGTDVHRAYREYLGQAPMPRKKISLEVDDIREFQLEIIRQIEERCLERLLQVEEHPGRLSVRTLVAWLSHHRCQLPASAVADYYGYRGPDTVRAIVGRLQMELEQRPRLAQLLQSVSVPATRYR